MIRRNIATGGEDDGWWIREADHLAALAEKEKEIIALRHIHSQHKSNMAEMAKHNSERDEQIAALTANLDRMRKNRDGLEQDWYALESGAHKAAEQIAALTCERDRLLYTVKMAYRKHHLDDPSTGWEELSTMLLTTLCENMGDEGFNEWLTAQKEGV